MHGPYAHAHGHGTAGHPQVHRPTTCRGNAPGQIQRGIRGQDRHTKGYEDQRGRIATNEHGESLKHRTGQYRLGEKTTDCTCFPMEHTAEYWLLAIIQEDPLSVQVSAP